jgi:hypothetical protein
MVIFHVLICIFLLMERASAGVLLRSHILAGSSTLPPHSSLEDLLEESAKQDRERLEKQRVDALAVLERLEIIITKAAAESTEIIAKAKGELVSERRTSTAKGAAKRSRKGRPRARNNIWNGFAGSFAGSCVVFVGLCMIAHKIAGHSSLLQPIDILVNRILDRGLSGIFFGDKRSRHMDRQTSLFRSSKAEIFRGRGACPPPH